MPQNKTLQRVAHTLINNYNLVYEKIPYESISYEVKNSKISSIYVNKILDKLIHRYFEVLEFRKKYKESTFRTYLNITRNIIKRKLGIPKNRKL